MKSRDLGSVFKNVIAKLIPDPVWYTDSFASQYHNAGSGISVVTAGLTVIVQVAMHGRHGHKARMSGPPEQDNS